MTDRLRELLERAMPLIYLVRWSADPAMGARAVELLGEIKRAVGEPETCAWTPIPDPETGAVTWYDCHCDLRRRSWPRALAEDGLHHDERCGGCGLTIKVIEESGGTT